MKNDYLGIMVWYASVKGGLQYAVSWDASESEATIEAYIEVGQKFRQIKWLLYILKYLYEIQLLKLSKSWSIYYYYYFNLMKGTTYACNCPTVLANSTLQFLDLWFSESFCFVSLFFAFFEVDYLKIIYYSKKSIFQNFLFR